MPDAIQPHPDAEKALVPLKGMLAHLWEVMAAMGGPDEIQSGWTSSSRFKISGSPGEVDYLLAVGTVRTLLREYGFAQHGQFYTVHEMLPWVANCVGLGVVDIRVRVTFTYAAGP